MTAIPSNAPTLRTPEMPQAEIPAKAAAAKAAETQEMSLESAARSQGEARRTMETIAAFQNAVIPQAKASEAQAAVHVRLTGDLAAAEANQSVDIYAIMGLCQKTAQETRNANREIRASELNAQVGELMGAADDMQKAANFRLAAGIVQGAVQMASGAMQAYGSIRAAGKSAQAMKPQSDATQAKESVQKMNDTAQQFSTEAKNLRTEAGVAGNTQGVKNLQAQAQVADDKASYLRANARSMEKLGSAKQAQVDSLNESARNSAATMDSASKLLGGAGEIVTAGLKFGADSADVSAKRHEARAKLHESASSQASEMMQQMMDVIRDIRDKLASIDQSRIETNRSIARNI